MDHLKELEGKHAHDKFNHYKVLDEPETPQHGARRVWVPGPVIVGGGPSGLAVAACLKQKGIPYVVLERSSCIGSLWKLRTYDRLRLHLPKEYCELPGLPYPPETPNYPTKRQFIAYLESYVKHFEIKPVFGMNVVSAEYDEKWELWRVKAAGDEEVTEYVCRWVVVATGENAEPAFPKIEGLEDFKGRLVHTTEYKCGNEFRGKSVLVVGSGNSGMEISLDLFHHSATTGIVVRDSLHVLPKEILGWSTFGIGFGLLKWLPVSVVDRLILIMSRLILGDTEKMGIRRPAMGPLQQKTSGEGKTPVLDAGTFAEIRAGNIKVYPGIKRVMQDSVEFVDGRIERFDGIILATGFRSDVPSWLKGSNMFSEKDGYPVKPFPNGWKGEKGVYAVGFTRRAILGLSHDAQRVAEDISGIWMKMDEDSKGDPYAKYSLKS